MKAFSTGWPGTMNASSTPAASLHASSAREANSGPLSTVIDSGTARQVTTRSNSAAAYRAVIDLSTYNARH